MRTMMYFRQLYYASPRWAFLLLNSYGILVLVEADTDVRILSPTISGTLFFFFERKGRRECSQKRCRIWNAVNHLDWILKNCFGHHCMTYKRSVAQMREDMDANATLSILATLCSNFLIVEQLRGLRVTYVVKHAELCIMYSLYTM